MPTAAEKAALIARVDALRRDGVSLNQACAAAGVPKATYKRWAGAHEAGGAAALVDGMSTGRKPGVELTGEEAAKLRWHRLRKGSIDLAVDEFIKDGASAETAAALQAIRERAAGRRRKANYPVSVRRAAHVTPDEEARFRGKKAAGNTEMVSHRGMYWIDPQGNEVEMRPDDIWESDDMSSNEPFRFWLDGEETLGRQTLITADVYSGAYLGLSPVGRPRDAYRAEDILDHMRDMVLAWGMPRAWRIERGAWGSNAIHGLPLDELGSAFDGKTWGGIGEVITLLTAWKSKQKGYIESSFNYFQSLMAHESESIGRVRGEFEDAAKLCRQIAGIKDAAKRERALAKFWSVGRFANVAAEKMEQFNATPKARRAFGKDTVAPDELRRDAARREFPEAELWRFLPCKQLRAVVNGAISISAPHYPRPFQFAINGAPGMEGKYCGGGHKVLVAFHPARPAEGCLIFNADMTSRNRDAWRFGELLGRAELMTDAPQMDLRPRGERGDVCSQQRRSNAAARTEFRAIADIGGGRAKGSGARASEARDGEGGAVRVETNYTTKTKSGARDARGGSSEEESLADMPPKRGGLSAADTPAAPRASRPASNEDEDDFATVSTAPPWDEDDWAHL